MAAQMISRRRQIQATAQHQHLEVDRDAELLAVITCEELEANGPLSNGPRANRKLTDGPVVISSDVLMGKMPKADKILKNGNIWRLTSYYEWKPMHIALTTAGLFFSRPGQDALRDLIPLYEIVDVKKRGEAPGADSRNNSGGVSDFSRATSKASSINSSKRNIKISTLLEDQGTVPMHIIQVRTIENGYNSGRTYYLRTDSPDTCQDWVQQLRTASDRAVMLKKAGPSLFRRIRFGGTYTLSQMHACTPHSREASARLYRPTRQKPLHSSARVTRSQHLLANAQISTYIGSSLRRR